jgi:AAA domain
LIVASDVQEEAMSYLWEPYIPRKMATILDGDPGTGKTGFACMLAAAMSRGYPLPDQVGLPTLTPPGPGAVLMVAMEDNLGSVIIKRLKRLGADLDQITFVNERKDEADNPHPFTLADLPLLTTYMEHVHPQLVYIDTIQAVLGGKLDINRANAVTAILGPLKKLAEDYNCAVVCSRHPAKPGQQVAKVLYRGMGSQAFVGTVRSGLFVEEHPEDETKSLLVHFKSNTGALGITHIFSKAQGHFEWCAVTRITHLMLAGTGGPGPTPTERIKACLWLERKLFGSVSLPASQMYKDAEDEHGWSQKVVRGASEYLKVIKTQVPGDFLWRLPPLKRPQRETTETSHISSLSGISGGTGDTGGIGVSKVSGIDSDFIDPADTPDRTVPSIRGSATTPQGPQSTPDTQSTPVQYVEEPSRVCTGNYNNGRAREASHCPDGRPHLWIGTDTGRLCSRCNAHAGQPS